MFSTTAGNSWVANNYRIMSKSFTEFNERLQFIIDELGMSANSFAKALNMPYATLHTYLRDNREPKASFFGALRKRFPDVNIDWLLLRTGQPFVGEKETTLYEQRIQELEKEIQHLQEKESIYKRMINLIDSGKPEPPKTKDRLPKRNPRNGPG